MSRGRFTALAVAALVVLAAALYLASRRNSAEPSAAGTLFLPQLASALGTVSQIDLQRGAAAPAVTLHRAGEQWSIAQRADYPADATKVHKLLLSLADAKIVEEKTSDPANFALIGVDDPASPKAAGTLITLTTKDGARGIIVGKPIGEGNFARRAGENRSFTVAPGITAEIEPKVWIDARLLDVPVEQIQSVEEKPASGPGYALHRLKPGEDGFGLDGALPAGRKLLDAKALAPSGSVLSGLTADDVAAASSIDFSKSSQAIFTLADGNVITVTGAAADDKRWIEVQSAKDPALDAKAQNRAFEVAGYRFEAIFRPMEQLLVPKETKPAGGAPAGPPAAVKTRPKPPVSRSMAPGAATPSSSPVPRAASPASSAAPGTATPNSSPVPKP
jgi:hypothetical protein